MLKISPLIRLYTRYGEIIQFYGGVLFGYILHNLNLHRVVRRLHLRKNGVSCELHGYCLVTSCTWAFSEDMYPVSEKGHSNLADLPSVKRY